jgi:hypothetical protein
LLIKLDRTFNETLNCLLGVTTQPLCS